MVENAKPKVKYIFCNRCRGETEHTLIGENYRDYPNYVDRHIIGIVERLGHRLWICSGCKSGTLEEYYIFDILDEGYKEDESMWDIKYYPPRNEFQISLKEFKQLTVNLTNIYKETLGAYNNNLTVLCALGIRSLLEGICADKEIVGKNLREKIDNMNTILPQNIVSNLHSIRFIGNEAAHKLSSPSANELKLAIELCEDLLNFIYELDYKAKSLTESRNIGKKKVKKIKAVKTSS